MVRREIDVSTTKWHGGARLILMVFGMLAIMQAAGGGEVKISGKTASDVFQNPQILALVEAACHGDLAKVDALVRQGADVNATGYRDMTPLFWTMLCKNYAAIEVLLTLGANPNYKMEGDVSAMWAAAGSNDPHFLPMMLAHGGDPNIRAGYRTALMIAIEQNRTKNIQLLLDHAADVNEHDEGGNSAATQAAALAKFDVVLLLLNRGYSYDLQDLANRVYVRVVGKDFSLNAERSKVLEVLEEKGIRAHVIPQVASPAPGTKPPTWWHPHSAGTSEKRGRRQLSRMRAATLHSPRRLG